MGNKEVKCFTAELRSKGIELGAFLDMLGKWKDINGSSHSAIYKMRDAR